MPWSRAKTIESSRSSGARMMAWGSEGGAARVEAKEAPLGMSSKGSMRPFSGAAARYLGSIKEKVSK